MSCQTCCKIFCSRRDQEENCSEKITYVEAGILEKVKVNKIRMDIEKDIKRCEKLTEPQNANWIGISNQIAIGHVIERIKELEEENRIFKNSNVLVNRYFRLKDNSIPKQKVKDKIKEIQEEYNKLDKEIDKQIKDKNKDYYKCKENIAIMQTLAYCRDKFEGLLEEK